MAVCAAGLLLPAAAQNNADEAPGGGGSPPMQVQAPDDSAPPDMSAQPPDQTAPDQGATMGQAPAPTEPVAPIRFAPTSIQAPAPFSNSVMNAQTAYASPSDAEPANLRLNFDNVPLNEVLNYLSDAAGFIIVMDTQVRGYVSVISSHPMTRTEAVDLLNSVLNQNGYAAIRNGRTLTIVNKDDAKMRNIPVQIGNDPNAIPANDEIVTQIIPVRYVDASQLVSDLTSFVSPQATIVANQAGNSIVITDTQENIRHLVEIVAAIDSSAAGETEIQVFKLDYANPNDVAAELGQIFPSGSSGNGLSPIAFRGGGGGPGGGFGGGGGFFARMAAAASANSSGNRAQKQSQVTAVADPRTQSVIVMASKDLMVEITGMMHELDVPSSRDQQVFTYTLRNADPQEALQVLQSTFPTSTSRGGSSSSSQQTENSSLVQRANEGATEAGQTYSSLSGNATTGMGRSGGSGGAP